MRFFPLILIVCLNCFAQATTVGTNVCLWGNGCGVTCPVPADLTNALGVAAGCEHCLALKRDGTVEAWGNDYYGQANVPAGLIGATAVAAGWGHSVALTNGGVAAWGENTSGQLVVPLGASSNVVAISASLDHSLALRSDGKVLAWGSNSNGQCNLPSLLKSSQAVAAGWAHSLSLAADGTVQAWGDNTYGQCSIPPILTNGSSMATAIAAGAYHSLAVLANGTVQAWGDNRYGQCSVPADLTNGTAVATTVAAGLYHSLALRADGTVEAWGGGSGNDEQGQSSVPSLPRVTNLSANYFQSLAVLNVMAPSIISSSPSQISAVGSAVCFYVVAAGAPPVAYQWYRNNIPLVGETTNALQLSGASVAEAGTNTYVVVVSNSAGSVTNSPILLRLQPALTVQLCPAITLYGEVNKQYQILSTPALGTLDGWKAIATVTITNNPQIYFDTLSIGRPMMFYELEAPASK